MLSLFYQTTKPFWNYNKLPSKVCPVISLLQVRGEASEWTRSLWSHVNLKFPWFEQILANCSSVCLDISVTSALPVEHLHSCRHNRYSYNVVCVQIRDSIALYHGRLDFCLAYYFCSDIASSVWRQCARAWNHARCSLFCRDL